MEAFTTTIAAYYAFNIEYPSALKPLLLFGERILMGINSGEKLPAAVNRIYSALDACIYFLTENLHHAALHVRELSCMHIYSSDNNIIANWSYSFYGMIHNTIIILYWNMFDAVPN